MKTSLRILLSVLFLGGGLTVSAQDSQLQHYRPAGQDGLNEFEAPKETDQEPLDGLTANLGCAFAIHFQMLSQSNSADSLPELGSNFNLPAANLDLDVQLQDGLTIHLRTYLSSRHHNESCVHGGYIQMYNLNFIS